MKHFNIWKILIPVFVIFISTGNWCHAQVGINTTGAAPASSAILDASSTSKGALLPRMTTAQRDSIAILCSCTPIEGLQIFNTTTKCFEAYVDGAWYSVSCPAACVKPATPGAITGPGTTCAGSSVTYSITAVTNAMVYTWALPNGATVTAGQGTTSVTVTFGTASGNISITAGNSCGTSAASVQAVTVNALPSVSAGAGSSGGSTIGGSPTASGGAGSYIYAWGPATGLSSTTVSNPTAGCSGGTTTYTVSVTDANTCSASSSVFVSRLLVNAGADVSGNPCSPSPLTLGGSPTASGGAGSYTYAWTPGSGLSSSTIANPVGTPSGTTPTAYAVVVTDANGCTASDTMNLSLGGTIKTYSYTSGPDSLTVPAGITCMMVQAYGGAGANANTGGGGGAGGYVQAQLSVTPGEKLYVFVGGAGGYNGGGGGGNYAGGGGGGSDIRLDISLASRVIVAGGGGGGGTFGTDGGSGGGADSANGGNGVRYGMSCGGCGCGKAGAGGTQIAGGAQGAYDGGYNSAETDGSLGYGGLGGWGWNNTGGGGGGGGYYGGGGGSGSNGGCISGYGGGGGGGGSSYAGTGTSNATYGLGVSAGNNGQIIIVY